MYFHVMQRQCPPTGGSRGVRAKGWAPYNAQAPSFEQRASGHRKRGATNVATSAEAER